jgi:phenylpropionate dioxygenase-like ring-hydroxylating dioxygenase large terminal subunit
MTTAPLDTHSRDYRPPTLDTLSPGQIAAIRSIPAHDQALAPSIDARRPAAIFTDGARYQLEQARVFRRLCVPVTPSALLREPGSVLAHDDYGLPLLLTRDRTGSVRAFLNACQHKGSKLIEDCAPRRATRISCPYHAWTYALDGTLVGVPRAETFTHLDKRTRGLAHLPCMEAGGLIWVNLGRLPEAMPAEHTHELARDLDALGLPSAHVYGRRSFHLQANWKLVLEPFLEGYHVQRLHAQSIGKLFADTPTVTHRIGPHIRQISGKANFMPEMLDVPGENIHKTVTHAYLVFPNTVVVTSPFYISVMFVLPTSVATSTVEYFMLTPSPPDNAKAEALYARSYELIQKVFGTEDFRAAEISQVGLASGALEEVVYSGLESAVVAYHEQLESFL